jgi:hypothetical protein
VDRIRICTTWDELPPVVHSEGETFSTRILEKKHRDAIAVAKALRDYIDSIPKSIEFGVTMPGVDRDWIDQVIDEG